MSDTIYSVPEPTTDGEYEAALELLLKELRTHEEHMNRNRVEIECLRAEAQVIASHTDLVLGSILKQLDALRKTNLGHVEEDTGSRQHDPHSVAHDPHSVA